VHKPLGEVQWLSAQVVVKPGPEKPLLQGAVQTPPCTRLLQDHDFVLAGCAYSFVLLQSVSAKQQIITSVPASEQLRGESILFP
jgi:hypothetical protein